MQGRSVAAQSRAVVSKAQVTQKATVQSEPQAMVETDVSEDTAAKVAMFCVSAAGAVAICWTAAASS